MRPRSATFERDHLRAALFEQLAVVADEEHGLRGVTEPLFEPALSRNVEVVVGLVEDQDVGVASQQRFQDQALLLAARQRADGPRCDIHERGSHRGDGAGIPQHLGVVAADVAPVCPRVREAQSGFGRSRRVGDALGGEEARVGFAELRRTDADQQLPNRGVVPDGADELAHDPEPAVDRDRAGRCVLVAGDDADERRLAHTVRADESAVLSVTDSERHVVEELAATRGAIRESGDLECAHERASVRRSSPGDRPIFGPTTDSPQLGGKNRRVRTARSSRVLLVLVAFVGRDGGAARSRPQVLRTRRPPGGEPNILFVLTDDLDRAELRFMPNTRRLIGGAGATFDRYFVSNSLCCPSRVTTLRGQYAHNTGIWANGGTNGGFEHALTEGIEQDTVATRLSGSGYRTALVGKYLNGYPNTVAPTYRPPGWHTFVSPALGKPYGEYHYVLNDNGRLEFHGAHSRDYGTACTCAAPSTSCALPCSADRHRSSRTSRCTRRTSRQRRHERTRSASHTLECRASAAYNQRDVYTMPSFIRELTAFQPW